MLQIQEGSYENFEFLSRSTLDHCILSTKYYLLGVVE